MHLYFNKTVERFLKLANTFRKSGKPKTKFDYNKQKNGVAIQSRKIILHTRAGARAVVLGGPSTYQGGGGAKFEIKYKSRSLQKSKLVNRGAKHVDWGARPPLAPALLHTMQSSSSKSSLLKAHLPNCIKNIINHLFIIYGWHKAVKLSSHIIKNSATDFW